jgi:hypothetical protein
LGPFQGAQADEALVYLLLEIICTVSPQNILTSYTAHLTQTRLRAGVTGDLLPNTTATAFTSQPHARVQPLPLLRSQPQTQTQSQPQPRPRPQPQTRSQPQQGWSGSDSDSESDELYLEKPPSNLPEFIKMVYRDVSGDAIVRYRAEDDEPEVRPESQCVRGWGSKRQCVGLRALLLRVSMGRSVGLSVGRSICAWVAGWLAGLVDVWVWVELHVCVLECVASTASYSAKAYRMAVLPSPLARPSTITSQQHQHHPHRPLTPTPTPSTHTTTPTDTNTNTIHPPHTAH